jgi:hypothetical protein
LAVVIIFDVLDADFIRLCLLHAYAQRRREASERGDPLPPQAAPSQVSDADWLGPPRGAAAQGYNKAGRGGFTFGSGPTPPGSDPFAAAVASLPGGGGGGGSVAPPPGGGASPGRGLVGGDENGDVRAQLWAMKLAAQEQRRGSHVHGGGASLPPGASPTRQPLANFAPDYQQQQPYQQPYQQPQPYPQYQPQQQHLPAGEV